MVAKEACLNLEPHGRTSLQLVVCTMLAEPAYSTRKVVIENNKTFALHYMVFVRTGRSLIFSCKTSTSFQSHCSRSASIVCTCWDSGSISIMIPAGFLHTALLKIEHTKGSTCSFFISKAKIKPFVWACETFGLGWLDSEV